MTTAEIKAPTRIATCCFQGVAPTRKPVLRSCEVVPPLDEAMQTTPAIESAVRRYSGPTQPEQDEDQAGQEQRGDRHPRDRVGRRADHAGDPRADRHEQEPEEDDHARRRSAGRGARSGSGATRRSPAPARASRRGPRGIGRSRSVRATPPSLARLPERRSRRLPVTEAEDQRQRIEHAQDAAGGHRAGADVADVLAGDRAGAHLGDPLLARRQDARQPVAEIGDHRHEQERRQ